MRMSDKCHNNNNSENPLTSRRTDGGKNKVRISHIDESFVSVRKSPRDVLHTILKLSISAFRLCTSITINQGT